MSRTSGVLTRMLSSAALASPGGGIAYAAVARARAEAPEVPLRAPVDVPTPGPALLPLPVSSRALLS